MIEKMSHGGVNLVSLRRQTHSFNRVTITVSISVIIQFLICRGSVSSVPHAARLPACVATAAGCCCGSVMSQQQQLTGAASQTSSSALSFNTFEI